MIYYNRKELKNKHKENKNFHVAEENVGSITGIMDKNGKYARIGDEITFIGRKHRYSGILLYNRYYDQYGIAMDIIAGHNKYDIDSYYSFVDIPTDNGARMHLEIVKSVSV